MCGCSASSAATQNTVTQCMSSRSLVTSREPQPVTSIRLSQNTLSLLEGWSCALTATTQPSSNVYSLKWTSSDPAIVKVDNNGLVTAIGSSGTAMTTVEPVLDPTVKDTCEVTITPYAGRPTKVSDVKIVNERQAF